MDQQTTDLLERNGIPTVFLAWRQPEDVKRVMRLIGDVLGKPAIAAEYISYFESAVPRVTTITGRILRERWPKALYCNLKRLTQDQLIGEWWIETAGGVSVTNNGRSVEAYPFSIEQMFTWDPDIFIVASPRI